MPEFDARTPTWYWYWTMWYWYCTMWYWYRTVPWVEGSARGLLLAKADVRNKEMPQAAREE